jgi:hypothetical protein
MSGGAKIEKGDRRWSDFKRLRAIRDHHAVHAKHDATIVSYAELAYLVNCMRQGAGRMLGTLHTCMGRIIPSHIINAGHMPLVEVVED